MPKPISRTTNRVSKRPAPPSVPYEPRLIASLKDPEEAAAYDYSEADQARIGRLRERAIFGTPDVVAGKLRQMAAELGVQEMAVLTTVHDATARQRSYTLLAAEFGLDARADRLAAD